MENTIKNTIDWDNSSNTSIKMELESLKVQQNTIIEIAARSCNSKIDAEVEILGFV